MKYIANQHTIGKLSNLCFIGAMSNPDPIAELLSRVAMRDQAAFARLFDTMSAKLFGISLRILGNKADAEDVLQEVFVKIWNKAATFQTGRASAVAWLSMIARNQAIDKLRARKLSHVDIEEQEYLADTKPSPEDNAVSTNENQRLKNCLEQLNPDHANAVKSTYLGGLSYQETADLLDIPLNTVRTWIRRSLISLQDCLRK